MLPSDAPAADPTVSILLADDRPDNLLALEAVLGGLGHRLVPARSGAETLRLLNEDDFAVVLLDVQMPDLNGYETAKRMRGQERTRHTPIIFLTAYDTPEFPPAKAYTLGAVDYLVKPLVPEVLRAKVAVFADLYQKAERLRRMEHHAYERKLAEERQRWELERLREEARRKDEFLAMLGHELRNPLAPIRNALQVVRMRGEDRREAVQWAHAMMDRQVQHLARLVDDLLDVSRITRGKLQLRKEPVDLAAVVPRAVETARPLIDTKGHRLHVALPAGPVHLEADPVRLAQVLSNLLNNAAKYTEDGGDIWLSAEEDGPEVVVRVRDTGIGIDAEMLPRVFDLFTQVDPSPDRSQGGLGIGLTLVRSLVEMHGGTVEAHSDGPGRGAEFVVRLPLVREARRAFNGSAAPEERRSARSRRILIVDDNVDAAESLTMLLKMTGHEVQTAHDGHAALEAARTYRPEVAVLDIGLPGMNGYEVARRLRQVPALDGLVLVALTGYGQEEDRRRARDAGFDHHLVKPVDPDELGRLF